MGTSNSTTTLNNSTVSGNLAASGAGLYTDDDGESDLSDCTVSGNTARDHGGGLSTAGGGTATLTGVTVGANSAGISGGGLYNPGGTVRLGNTIVAANSAAASGPDALGPVDSLGYNLVGVIDGSSGWASDLIGTAAQPLGPLLAPLGNYGGPTQPMALLPGSPAIDAGSDALIAAGIATDQRGLARIVDGVVDIGAFESNLFTMVATSGSGQSTGILTAFPAPLVATVTANNPIEPVAGGLVTFAPPQDGASATLGGNPATIADDGTASVSALANGIVGRYAVPAGALGITNTASFTLTNQAIPTIATTPSTTAVTLGTSPVTLGDTAILAHGYDETGTITFTLYLGHTLVDTEYVAVNGDGQYTTPAGYTLPASGTVTGTYQWDATYSGDPFNTVATEDDATAERTVVVAASPSIVTTPSAPAMTLGTTAPTLKDTATLSGGYHETGTITFTLVGPGGSTLDTETVPVAGGGSYTTPTGYTLPITGSVIRTYQWSASYSGDPNNYPAGESGAAGERTVVCPATPGITTTPGPTSLTLTSSVPGPLNDSAALANGYFPTGTITFTLTYNGSVVYTDHVAANGNGTYSTAAGDHPGGYSLSSTGTVVGTYQWNASYSGDANDSTANDQGGTSEQATVNPASPTIVTTPGGTVSMAGSTISGVKYLDATGDGFSADDTRQGGVTIDLYQVVNGCRTPVGSTITASDGTYSFTGYSPGTYEVAESVPSGYIQTGGGPNGTAGNAYYTINAPTGQNDSGINFDDYLIPSNPCTSFVFKVGSGWSATSASTLSGHTSQGQTVSVALPSGSSPVYTLVVYTAPSPSFSDSNAYRQTIFQVSSGSYSTAPNHTLSVTIPNCYYQIDFVCGQAIGQLEPNQNNNAYGPDSAEILYTPQGRLISADNGGCTAPNPMPTGHPATPPSPVTVPTSTSTLTDTATLSGGYRPGGAITFYLFVPGVTPNGTYSNNVYSDTVAVNGNGTYNTATGTNPGGYVPTGPGTYEWVAVYSGDPNNNGVADAFGAEPESVKAPPPSLSTTPGGPVTLGGMSRLTDTATLSSGDNPTGTITFYLFAPGVTPNSTYGNNVYSDAVTVNGAGTYTTAAGTNPGGYSPTAAGTYQWVAVYSGDASNGGVADTFGAEPEAVNASSSVSCGQFGTIGFWQNPNGQATIKSFNGGSSSTQLGTWLASNFPNLFGARNPYINCSLAGLTNAQVASVYKNLWNPSGATKNTYVQAFAVALGIYADTGSLGGNATAQGFGFNVSSTGGSGSTFNVGGNGSAFGVSNNSRLSVYRILQTLNSNFSPSTDCFYGNNQSLTGAANNVVNGINTTGDVTNGLTLSAPSGLAYTPAQIRDAYGINNLSMDGTGETIAIVDAYNDPAIFQAVDAFDSQFSPADSGPTLYDQYGDASMFLTVLNQSGQADSLPPVDPNGPGTANWEMEEALDVEWIHAIAPGAQIILVEADSQSLSDLMAAVGTAAAQPGVSVVSMSWGFTEGQSVFAADEATYDSVFNVPGVTFLASTGDYGAADPEYPSFSPNVVAVGGSALTLNADNSYDSETGWGSYSDAAGTMIGSGGGISLYEAEPSFQRGVQSTGYRTTPDVATVADPNTGAWIADPYNLDPSNPLEAVGGTSLSAPIWAGLVAMVNQGRAAAGEAALNSSGPSETLQALYGLPQSDYHSITGGSNGYPANAGYNLVTGLGTPIADSLVPDLVAYQGPGTAYAGPTVGPLQDATLSGSWTAGGDTANVFSVFNAMPVGHRGFAARGHGMETTDTAGRPAISLAKEVSGSTDAVPAPGIPRAQPTSTATVGSVATGSDSRPIGVVPTNDVQEAHDAVLADRSSSPEQAAVRSVNVTTPGVAGASRTSALQGALVDSALEDFGAMPSLLGTGDQVLLVKPRRSIGSSIGP